MRAAEILDRFGAVPAEQGDGFDALCPVHEADGAHSPSLRIDFTDEGRALVICRSRRCEFGAVVAAVGLSPRDLSGVSYVGQSTRRPGGGKAAAPEAARVTAAGGAYRAARALADHLRDEPEGAAGRLLRDRFGLDPVTLGNPDAAEAWGLGWDADDARLTITARTAEGAVAWVQGRATDPDARVRWLGLSNPVGDDGTAVGRWDAAGLVGRSRGGRPVVITEGPSDGLAVAALDTFDVVAIRGAAQAGRVVEVDAVLRGAEVYIAADNDPAGRRFRDVVAETVAATARRVALVDLPNGLDVGDFRAIDADTFGVRFAMLLESAREYAVPDAEVDMTTLLASSASDVDFARVALRFLRTSGQDLAFTDAHGFLYWDGGQWRLGATAQARQAFYRLADTLRRAAGLALIAGDQDRSRRILDRAGLLSTTRHINAAMTELQHLPEVRSTAGEWDTQPDLLPVANGILDLRTGTLRPATPADKFTRRLSTEYRPDAEAPRFARFLREVIVDEKGAPDETTIQYLQAALGYGVTGWTSEQILLLLTSQGESGKSVLVNTITNAFREQTTPAAFSTFEKKAASSAIPNDLAALAGARMVVAQESNLDTRMDEALIKTVTGGDAVRARFLHREWFTFTPTFLLLLVTNHLPEFRGQDHALWRRIRVIPFRRQFSGGQREAGLQEVLNAEAPGVLRWLADGARAWYAAGRRLPEAPAVTEASSRFREDSDVLAEFVSEYLEATGNVADVAPGTDVLAAYLEWFATNAAGTREKPYGRNTLYRMVSERIGPMRRGTLPRRWHGYRLRTAAQVEHRRAALLREARAEAGGPATRSANVTALPTREQAPTVRAPRLLGPDLSEVL